MATSRHGVRILDPTPDRFVKEATDDGGTRSLLREAELLELARHPGVVELVGVEDHDGRPALVTRRVLGTGLASRPALSVEEACGLLAGVASTVADLHEVGVVHGAIAPEHVLVTAEGRPVLCGFGHGARAGQPPLALPALPEGFTDPARSSTEALDPSTDVFGLGALMGWMLQSGAVARPGRAGLKLRALGARATLVDPSRRPSAGELASALAAAVEDGRVPARPRARRLAPAVAGMVLAAVLVSLTARTVVNRPGGAGETAPSITRAPQDAPVTTEPARGPTTRGPVTTAPNCPPASGLLSADTDGDGCAEELRYADGVLEGSGGRWSVGTRGDQVATGDWQCTGSSTLALLRPASGDIYLFDGWAPPGHDLVAGVVARVDGAFALRRADLDGDSCPELMVERRTGPPTTVALR